MKVTVDIAYRDDEHWITVHPGQNREHGQHVLIEGSSSKGYTVKAGAGGKLTGLKITPKSMSQPVGKKAAPPAETSASRQAKSHETVSHTGKTTPASPEPQPIALVKKAPVTITTKLAYLRAGLLKQKANDKTGKSQELIDKIDEIDKINKALSPKDLAHITPTPYSDVVSREINRLLHDLKVLSGLTVPPATPEKIAPAPNQPSAASTPPHIQEAINKVFEGVPKERVARHSVIEDARGNKIAAALLLDTSKIADHGEKKVAAALASSYQKRINEQMQDYKNEVVKTLTGEEYDAAKAYKGPMYRDINRALLGIKKPDEFSEKLINNLSSAINKTAVPADLTVYRGMACTLQDLSGESDPNKIVGKCFIHKNFASVSRSSQTAVNFSANSGNGNVPHRLILRMTLPKGTPGLVLGGQDDHSEQEIVLDKASIFRIDRVVPVNERMTEVHVTHLGTKHEAA